MAWGTAQWGSSPRAWGALTATTSAARRRRDHPHERGEHCCFTGVLGACVGSSPRAWGTRVGRAVLAVGVGIIPTSVGNTPSRSLLPVCWRDHPHERGEHLDEKGERSLNEGSSPRAWGTQVPDVRLRCVEGIIPTSVGNTAALLPELRKEGDHPHERGEHDGQGLIFGAGRGSSPRAWGTRRGSRTRDPPHRIIPTSVGNTSRPCTRPCPWWDHPHERGEHHRSKRSRSRLSGSSPRAWGTRLCVESRHLRRGIIPTSVGNTTGPRDPGAACRDHPHERGEHPCFATP